MHRLYRQIIFGFTFFGFLFLFLGGEYLHSEIHDHTPRTVEEHSCQHDYHHHHGHKDEEHTEDGEEDDCPIFKLLVQGFIESSMDSVAFAARIQSYRYIYLELFAFQSDFSLNPPRGPPLTSPLV